jgi:methylated-DNA-[protein]-cysteine S-methyltransferase
MTAFFSLFDTPIGPCAIAWSERGIAGVQFPEGSAEATRARMNDRFPAATEHAPSAEIEEVIGRIVALLRGEAADLAGARLDMTGVPPFHRRAYEVMRAIPPGATLSYGEIAARMGEAGAARAVGQAARRNPFAIVVPCHRVLAAGGKTGGFTANGGTDTKRRLLAIEGALPPALFDGGQRLAYDAEAAVRHLSAVDPVLAKVIETVGPFKLRLAVATSLFEALAEAIVYQQLTGKAAAKIFSRVQALFPRGRLTPAAIAACGEDRLRAAGLSRAKVLAIQDLANKTAAGMVPSLAEIDRLEDAEIIERLTQVRGIGRWTVEMLLIFRLGRPDVLPVGDYGIRKAFARAFDQDELPSPKDLAAYGARWTPFRSVASWYLWAVADAPKR